MRKKNVLVLIPTRLNSRRLPAKALVPINKLPLILHVYRRAKCSKKVDDVIICCDEKKILTAAKKFGANALLTSKHHTNGTERICEAYKKIGKNYKLVIDVQGDEPLVSPAHIDKVISFHLKNLDADIVLPNLKLKTGNNTNIVKVVTNKNNEVLKDIKNYMIVLNSMMETIKSEFENNLEERLNDFMSKKNNKKISISIWESLLALHCR